MLVQVLTRELATAVNDVERLEDALARLVNGDNWRESVDESLRSKIGEARRHMENCKELLFRAAALEKTGVEDWVFDLPPEDLGEQCHEPPTHATPYLPSNPDCNTEGLERAEHGAHYRPSGAYAL